MDGWIKTYNSLLEWRWASDPLSVALWVHLLLKCNHPDKIWMNMTIKRGQYITSVSKLSADTGLTSKQTRVRLERLVETGEIVTQRTNKYTIITICKYDIYQMNQTCTGQTEGKQRASKTASKTPKKGKQRAINDGYSNYSVTVSECVDYQDEISITEHAEGKQRANEILEKGKQDFGKRATKKEYKNNNITTYLPNACARERNDCDDNDWKLKVLDRLYTDVDWLSLVSSEIKIPTLRILQGIETLKNQLETEGDDSSTERELIKHLKNKLYQMKRFDEIENAKKQSNGTTTANRQPYGTTAELLRNDIEQTFRRIAIEGSSSETAAPDVSFLFKPV